MGTAMRSSNCDYNRHLLALSRYLAMLAVLAICSSSSAKDKESSEVNFTSRTELVLIPTLVLDKSGTHVTGLKKEDFTVRMVPSGRFPPSRKYRAIPTACRAARIPANSAIP